ncbi:hypothetical protein [Paenibacillus bouchesdurhonensis]|uniref:hypothetical protein n=1 Tax=Paenibacillus bouchesdurhonensis TaxID=1870990 RepID=UPI001F352911|nr:hypothetical protein [Paenibacillus bouchesdurhonensis]
MYVVIIVMVIIAGIGTLLVGTSRQNKTGNPNYDKRTKKNMVGLTLMYAASIIVVIVLVAMILD